jgi:hypothetical protein
MRCRQSARLTPAAAIRINTSPSFGSGTGRVAGTSISGPPGALISMTVCVAGILASTNNSLFLGGAVGNLQLSQILLFAASAANQQQILLSVAICRVLPRSSQHAISHRRLLCKQGNFSVVIIATETSRFRPLLFNANGICTNSMHS